MNCGDIFTQCPGFDEGENNSVGSQKLKRTTEWNEVTFSMQCPGELLLQPSGKVRRIMISIMKKLSFFKLNEPEPIVSNT